MAYYKQHPTDRRYVMIPITTTRYQQANLAIQPNRSSHLSLPKHGFDWQYQSLMHNALRRPSLRYWQSDADLAGQSDSNWQQAWRLGQKRHQPWIQTNCLVLLF